MVCPASVRLCADLPDTTSAAAADGTFAHELLEHCLKNGEFDASTYVGMSLDDNAAKPGFNGPFYTQEHVDAVNVALQHVFVATLEKGDELFSEVRIDLSQIRDGMFGTCDILIYKPATRTLHVADFKYGFKFVDVTGNPQARYYALGALHKLLAEGRAVDAVVSTIIQPRIFGADPVRSETIDAFDLLEWSSELAAAVKRTEDPNAPFVPGSHCDFCKAAGSRCDTLRQTAVAAGTLPNGTVANPTSFDAIELGERLDQAELLAIYLERLADHAKSEAKAGRMPVGYKFIEGKKNRTYKPDATPEAVAKYILNATKVDVATVETKVPTPAQLEKKLGAKTYALVAKAIIDEGRYGPQFVKASHPAKEIQYQEAATSALGAVSI